MAIPISIEHLIGRQIVESSCIEFKQEYNPAAIIRTICAFANDIDNLGGGYRWSYGIYMTVRGGR